MRKLFYMGLESYNSRYTYQLQNWNETVFKRRNLDYTIVNGQTIDDTQSISVGQVLDAHGRSYYSMSQMMNLVQMMKNGELNCEDAVFFEDMFTPGIESIPYILNQIPREQRPKIWVRCLAQSIDPDDFVHVWNMHKWMGYYEKMVNEFATGILASNEEMVANMRIAGWTAPIYNISGLAFGKQEVRSRVKNIKKFTERNNRIVFAARWDQEKQPDFFMDLAEELKNLDFEFAVAQGGELKSNNPQYLERARKLESQGILKIYENLSKNQYYELLNDSKVLMNNALQDWTSNTVSEADALGCNVLFPAYRSFPEIFANDHTRMFVPWSMQDAREKLFSLLKEPHDKTGEISNWTDKTVDRYVDIMQGNGEQWARNNSRYRDNVATNKY